MFKLIFFFILLIPLEISGQLLKQNRLFVGIGNKYVLSEKVNIDAENGYHVTQNQEFNTLFIWQKNKVIRIIFKYERKLANKKKLDVSHLPSLDKLIPAFRREKIYYRTRKNTSERYDECFCKRPGGKFYCSSWNNQENLYNYRYQLKKNINRWNKEHNPLADTFGWIVIADGNPEVFEKNKHRKNNYVNNLPLIFDSPKHDSLYLIKPYYINIYRFDADKQVKSGQYYELYSTISLIDDFFSSESAGFDLNKHSLETAWRDDYDHNYQFNVEYFIAHHTLKSLFKLNVSYGEESAIKFLEDHDLSKQKNYSLPYTIYTEEDNRMFTDTTPDKRLSKAENAERKIRLRRYDSLSRIWRQREDSVKKAYDEDCYGHYQFCKECYNSSIPKTERLKRGCPVNIAPVGTVSESNWSYGFSAKNINYFKVENSDYRIAEHGDLETDESFGVVISDESYPIVWQLASPGIGFWLSNMSVNKRKIGTLPIEGLTLNNIPVNSL